MQDENRKFYEDFGTRIRFLRKARRLTLQDLGGKSSTAKSWEDGTMPASDKWEEVSSRLGLSVSFVFLGEPRSTADFDFIAKFADELPPPKEEARRPNLFVSYSSLDIPLVDEARRLLEGALEEAKGDPAWLGWIVTELRSLRRSMGNLKTPQIQQTPMPEIKRPVETPK